MTGVQRSAHEIVNRLLLDEEGDYRLVSPYFSGKSADRLQVEQRGYIRLGHLWEQVELPMIVRKLGERAVLYSPMTSGPLAVSRQVVTVHDLFPVEHPEWFSRAFSAWYRWLWPRLLPKVACVVTNSNYTRQRVLERYGLPEEKVITCYFAQSEHFRPALAQEITEFRIQRELPSRYLLYVGSIEPRKNLKTLAAAWQLTTAREEGVRLVIAGGAARKAVFSTAGIGEEFLKDPTIHLVGYVPDEHLPLVYGGAEAFALPSLAEGFGLPILEAMACGTPVICSGDTALPEVAGGAARLVPALKVEAWAEAIDDVLSDPGLRRRMSDAGIKRASQFSWLETAGAVRSLLKVV
jgi:glycosyltransferase involved in cell wall biosynthesis